MTDHSTDAHPWTERLTGALWLAPFEEKVLVTGPGDAFE